MKPKIIDQGYVAKQFFENNPIEFQPEEGKLKKVFEVFTGEMALRLQTQEQFGRRGWDRAAHVRSYRGGLFQRIVANALNMDWVDVANLAMIAWYHEQKK